MSDVLKLLTKLYLSDKHCLELGGGCETSLARHGRSRSSLEGHAAEGVRGGISDCAQPQPGLGPARAEPRCPLLLSPFHAWLGLVTGSYTGARSCFQTTLAKPHV